MSRGIMHYRTSIVVTAFSLFAALQVAFAASSTEKFRNEKVIVLEETLAPAETEAKPINLPSMVVYMAGKCAEIVETARKPQETAVTEGGVLFQQANSGVLRNTGETPLHFVRIGYLTDGSSEIWGMTGLSPNYKMLLEDRYGRAYDIKIPAGTKEPQHTHHDRVVISLSGAKLEHILPSGQIQPSTLQTGEIVWRLGGTHVGHNMGSTNLWVIAVEPK
jgi:hypothetical protein